MPANSAVIAAGLSIDDGVVVEPVVVEPVVVKPVVVEPVLVETVLVETVLVVAASTGLFPELWPRRAAAIAATTATTITPPSNWTRRVRLMVTACRSRRRPE